MLEASDDRRRTAGRRQPRNERTSQVEPTRSQRILVVDDEPSIVDAVATSLRYEGFDVEEAINGRLALAAAQDDPPDLIVLDVMLPDLDGLEVTRRLRADGIAGPRPVPHRPRRRRGQGGRADRRRRRLRDQTLRPGRDRGPGPRHPAPDRERATEDEGILRFADIEMDENAHEVTRAGQPDPAHRHRVQPAALLPAQPPPCAVQGPDPRPRLALRLRW